MSDDVDVVKRVTEDELRSEGTTALNNLMATIAGLRELNTRLTTELMGATTLLVKLSEQNTQLVDQNLELTNALRQRSSCTPPDAKPQYVFGPGRRVRRVDNQ